MLDEQASAPHMTSAMTSAPNPGGTPRPGDPGSGARGSGYHGSGDHGSGDRAPILVTGAPRSGSTWLGNVLCLAPNVGFVHEPFNRHCSSGLCRADFPHSFVEVTEANEARYLEAMQDTLAWRFSPGAELRAIPARAKPRPPRALARLVRDYAYFEQMRRRGARMVVKDPIALFSADWIARRFGAKVVVLIRHPAGFVASMRAAGFVMNFEAFRRQPALMEGRLAPFADEIRAAAPHRSPSIEANTLLWRILHHHIDLLSREHPDWIFVRHEDLSRDPAAAFPPLFERLGLPFTAEVAAGLAQFTSDQPALGRFSLFGTRRRTMRSSSASVHAFRNRLDPEEIATIRRLASPIWERFYDAGDWEPPRS